MIAKIMQYVRHPEKLVIFLQNRCNFPVLSDKTYLKIKYKLTMGKKLDLENPQTFNEKLQWLKIYDRKPEYTTMVDKHEVKTYVAGKIGQEYIIPTLGVWDCFEDIDFDSLPNQFVLKCTHDSGGLVIVKDKAELDRAAAKKKIEKTLKKNYYYSGREWPYKDVKPRILAEAYLEDDDREDLSDYKVMCFGGEPKMIQLHRGRFGVHTQDFYDDQWEKLDITRGVPSSEEKMERPAFLEEMLELSRKLSDNTPQLRVDWYFTNGRLYFGELTFFPAGGMKAFEPESWDRTFGSWIKLPRD